MGKFSEYNLPIKTLSKGTHTFEYTLSKKFFDDMECSDVRDASLTAEVTVVHENDFYDVVFDVKGYVVVPCDRCLDDLELPIDADYHLVVKYGEDYSESSDELLVLPERDTTLNISYMLADTVMLAIPLKHVHPLGKCNRSMSAILKKHRSHGSSGEDLDLENELIDEISDMASDGQSDDNSRPADPRWEGLKKLAEDPELPEE